MDRSLPPRPWTDAERAILRERYRRTPDAAPTEFPGRNLVVWEKPPADQRDRAFWARVLDAIELAGSRLVGGDFAWRIRERRETALASTATLARKPDGTLVAIAPDPAKRRRHLNEAAKARYSASLGDPFPQQDEHARAVFVNTLTVCVPELPFTAVAALAWWLGLLPATFRFNVDHRRALERLADRHGRADSVAAVEAGVYARRRSRHRPSSTSVSAKRVAERVVARAPRRRQQAEEALARAAAGPAPSAPATRAGRKPRRERADASP